MPSRIVLLSSSEIESVNIDGSSAATLARVPGSAEVNVTNLQLAYALLPDLASRVRAIVAVGRIRSG